MSKKSRIAVRATVQPWQTPKYDEINDNDNDYNEHHIRIYESLYQSEAWRHLSMHAKCLYMLLLSRYKGNYTGNEVTCPFSVCEEYGFRRQSLKKYFDELDRAGFINCQRFDDHMHKRCNHYILTAWWWKKEDSSIHDN